MEKNKKEHQSRQAVRPSPKLYALLIIGGLFIVVLTCYGIALLSMVWEGFRELFPFAVAFIGAALIVGFATFRVIFKKYRAWAVRHEEHKRIEYLTEHASLIEHASVDRLTEHYTTEPDFLEYLEENDLPRKQQNSVKEYE